MTVSVRKSFSKAQPARPEVKPITPKAWLNGWLGLRSGWLGLRHGWLGLRIGRGQSDGGTDRQKIPPIYRT